MTVTKPATTLAPHSAARLEQLSQCPPALRMAVDIALNAPVPTAVLWGAHHQLIANPALVEALGLPIPRPGQALRDLLPEPDYPLAVALQAASEGDRSVVPGLRPASGTSVSARLSAHFAPVRDDKGMVIGIWLTVLADPSTGVNDGVLEARLAEQRRAHQASEERLRLALDATHAVGTWDWYIREDRFIADAHFAYMHNVDPVQAGQRPIGDYLAAVHPEDRVFVARRIKACMHGSGEFAEEYRLLQADGGWRWVFARGRCFRDDHGRPARFIGASIDITERKLAEQALRELNETLEQRVAERTRALIDANRRLLAEAQERERAEELLRHAQKMEAVGQLTGGIAHDFNNMLTGIMGSLDLMNRYIAKGRSAEIGRFADAALSSAQRAAALTHRLLAFSRRQSLDRQRIDLNTLVLSLEDLLARTTGEQIELRLELAPDVWPVHTDPNQLESALLNLVINARDAMPDGGRLLITSGNQLIDDPRENPPMEPVRPGHYVTLCVKDTGSGMSASTRAKAFDPFFTTKPTGQGTGLGLSMIYGFAQQSGGHVSLVSELGQGTEVCLYLPRYLEPHAAQATLEAECIPPLAQEGESVLVVEDDPAVRMLILNVLDELGYRGHPAADAEVAVPLLDSALRIDLLVTDVGLPGMNGRQLAEIARDRRPGLKVLFMTGYIDKAADRDTYLEEGMDIVSKPFTLEMLASKVRQMIGD
ncbi:hybrid sensor histidine kinase/response regulator [Pseudomonas japonica]|uniref:hybrid sensor histidine kinase/response regulator n=1 Tax=Pseudomonas japonica TaxID=256466 RepID=UPI0015E36935|nr:hybrid sensor histidine kinase/response regulator [Pseudomonas japonica]MBA1288615.1 response regulator [Pseudomonas japonica]